MGIAESIDPGQPVRFVPVFIILSRSSNKVPFHVTGHMFVFQRIKKTKQYFHLLS